MREKVYVKQIRADESQAREANEVRDPERLGEFESAPAHFRPRRNDDEQSRS